MNLIKGRGRKRNRGADHTLQNRTTGRDAGGEDLGETESSRARGCAPEACAESDENAVESLELLNSLMQFAGDASRGASAQPDEASDEFTRFQIVEGPITACPTAAISEADQANSQLIDTSMWFEVSGPSPVYLSIEEPEQSISESFSVDCNPENSSEVTSGDASEASQSSSAEIGFAMGNDFVESGFEEAAESSRNERRMHPREDRSDLVWIEYFNSAMESTGKEAARAENVGAGGMRVGIKSAPTELERVIVSYSYRGFESCSLVRSRYQGEDGKERLCLEFVDREWRVNLAPIPAENSATEVNPGKILLADDDSAFRKILGNILIKAGYDVVLAEDGQSAVEKARSENPDLVITDGLMPKLHGFQVCKTVKELNPQLKVIMLTAVYTTPNYMWEAKNRFGADDIITKPCQVSDLLRKIEKHMAASGAVV